MTIVWVVDPGPAVHHGQDEFGETIDDDEGGRCSPGQVVNFKSHHQHDGHIEHGQDSLAYIVDGVAPAVIDEFQP